MTRVNAAGAFKARRELPWGGAPAVDIVEKDIEVTIAGGALTIKGQKPGHQIKVESG